MGVKYGAPGAPWLTMTIVSEQRGKVISESNDNRARGYLNAACTVSDGFVIILGAACSSFLRWLGATVGAMLSPVACR